MANNDPEEGVWQVAGRRNRRSRCPGSESGRRTPWPPSQSTSKTTTKTDSNSNHDSSSSSRGARGRRNHRPIGKFSYSSRIGREPPPLKKQQQQQQQSEEEVVKRELRELELLQGFLRRTALWQRLVEGLASVLPQLVGQAPPPQADASLLLPAGTAGEGVLSLPSVAVDEVDMLEARDGDAIGQLGTGCSPEVLQIMTTNAENPRPSEPEATTAPSVVAPSICRSREKGGRETAEATATHAVAGCSETLCLQPSVRCQGGQKRTGGNYAAGASAEAAAAPGAPQAQQLKGPAVVGTPRRGLLCELVCYGIGNFSESHNARYQLALALCLRDLLFPPINNAEGGGEGASDDNDCSSCSAKGRRSVELDSDPSVVPQGEQLQQGRTTTAMAVDGYGLLLPAARSEDDGRGSLKARGRYPRAARGNGSSGPVMLVFDPVMGDTEKAMLTSLGCGILDNEEGKRRCCDGAEAGEGGGGDGEGGVRTRRTLFFMPHCPQYLYSNVLWANWSSPALGSIAILGNRLSSYRDRAIYAKDRDDPTNAVMRAGPLLQETDVLPYSPADKGRWRLDVDLLPHLEGAFNELTLSFSGHEARSSAEGVEALLNRPLELVS